MLRFVLIAVLLFVFARLLSRKYLTYAIDVIGDAGKSEYASLENIMKTGRDQAGLYKEIADKLGVGKAYVVGASEGGFIGSNHALYFPGRVEIVEAGHLMGAELPGQVNALIMDFFAGD